MMEADDVRDKDGAISKLERENEILRVQLMSREREVDDLRKEVDDLHESISYRLGRRIAETWPGVWLKSILKRYFFR